MQRGRVFLIPFAFLLMVFSVRSAQVLAQEAGEGVTVTATVDSTDLEVGDHFTLTVTVTAKNKTVSPSEPRLPDLDGFELLGRSSGMESRHEFINGKIQALVSQKYHYVLSPQKKGKLKIGEAEVVVDGKALSTQPITVTVKEAGKGGGGQVRRPKKGQAPDPFGGGFGDDEVDDLFTQLLKRRGLTPPPGFGGRGQVAPPDEEDGAGAPPVVGGGSFSPANPNEAFFVHLEVDKKQVYVGEQITAKFYLYTRNAIRDIDTLKYPDLKAFWKEDIEVATRLNFQEVVVNGLPFRRALLAAFALFPLKAGDAVIDPYKAKCNVVVSQGGFGNILGQSFTYTRTSPEVKIKVSPLPAENTPADFTGAVGTFSIKATVGESQVPVGQPFSYKIRIEGRGNAKTVEKPPQSLPDSVELYDTKTDAKFLPTGESYKEFELFLIPRKQGQLTLPQVSISTFDPVSKRYVQSVAPAVTVQVGASRGDEVAGSRPLDSKSLEKSGGRELRLPDPVLNAKLPLRQKLPMTPIWIVVFMAIAVILTYKARIELGWGEAKRTIRKDLDIRIRAVRNLIDKGDYRAVGAKTLNAAYYVFGQVSTDGTSAIPIEKLIRDLPPSLRREVEAPLKELLVTFESLTFAPENMIGKMKEKEFLSQKVQDMEKLLVKAITDEASGTRESGEVKA